MILMVIIYFPMRFNVHVINLGIISSWARIPKRIQAGDSILPVAATHPPTGGRAPGIDPTNVFKVVILLRGV